MTLSVSVLYASEDQPEIVEHIQVQERPGLIEEPVSSEPPLPLIHSIEETGNQILTVMRAIGELYATNVHSATAEFLASFERCIEGKPFSKRGKSNVHHEIKSAEAVFDDKILDAMGQMMLQVEMLQEEVETLTGRRSQELSEQIIETEGQVLNEDIRIQQMIEDSTVELGYLMRTSAANKEMKAYLRGLKFGVAEPK